MKYCWSTLIIKYQHNQFSVLNQNIWHLLIWVDNKENTRHIMKHAHFVDFSIFSETSVLSSLNSIYCNSNLSKTLTDCDLWIQSNKNMNTWLYNYHKQVVFFYIVFDNWNNEILPQHIVDDENRSTSQEGLRQWDQSWMWERKDARIL